MLNDILVEVIVSIISSTITSALTYAWKKDREGANQVALTISFVVIGIILIALFNMPAIPVIPIAFAISFLVVLVFDRAFHPS